MPIAADALNDESVNTGGPELASGDSRRDDSAPHEPATRGADVTAVALQLRAWNERARERARAHQDALLEEALDETFPCSDPVSAASPAVVPECDLRATWTDDEFVVSLVFRHAPIAAPGPSA